MKSAKIVETLGPFVVRKFQGRAYLYWAGDQIAQCIAGDYVKRFGGLIGWLLRLKKTAEERCERIGGQIDALENEYEERHTLIAAVKDVDTGQRLGKALLTKPARYTGLLPAELKATEKFKPCTATIRTLKI